MISEEVLERLSERLVDRIENLNTFMINKLGKQMVDIGTLTPSQLREVLQSVKYGNDLEEIVEKISDITDMNVKDIYEIFEEVAKQNQEYAKQFYEYKNINFIPYEHNKTLQEHVKNIAKATANEYINISNTLAYMKTNSKGLKEYTKISDIYQKMTDEAILNISQGRDSYEMTIKHAMREMTANGLKTIDFATGYSRRADSSIRMNIMDGIRRLSRNLQEEFGKEFGADGIEVSHHKYAAPDHIDTIDGRQFSAKGEVIINGIKYQDYNVVNYNLDRHVGELNCYHFPMQIVLGVTKPLYSKEQLEADKKDNMKGFDFEGNHYTMYEGTQLQRQIETKIRQYKDRQIGAKSINDMDEVYRCQEKISQLTNKYKELSDISGLPTKVDRLRVDGYRKVSINKKSINNIENINYTDVTKEWLENAEPNSHKVEDRQYFEKDNIKYQVDDKNVVLDYSNKEKEVAEWLENKFGGEIYMLPRVNNPEGISTSDYLFRGEYWDLKEINGTGKNILFHAIEDHEKQAHNFIFDITKTKLTNDEIIERLNKLYSLNKVSWLEKVIIKKENKLVKVTKRSDPSD